MSPAMSGSASGMSGGWGGAAGWCIRGIVRSAVACQACGAGRAVPLHGMGAFQASAERSRSSISQA